MDFRDEASTIRGPEEFANAILERCFTGGPIEYPINPFALLKKVGIVFTLMNFRKLEGIYIPAENDDDIPVIGINVNRRITRQRFTAAHELCHHFRDHDKPIQCPIGAKTQEERFAEKFAAALLMPLSELKKQVDKRRDSNGYVSFDSVLEIANYFGVSFNACLFRIAYRLKAIEGETEPSALKKRATQYKPESVRKEKHLSQANLYADLLDACEEQFSFSQSQYAKNLFQNNYIYNDSRMEGLDINREQAAEIVADLRMNTQNSKFCSEEYEPFLSIAGHYDMYNAIFKESDDGHFDVYSLFKLNNLLFTYYPYTDYGGATRETNTLVLGAKFEAVDFKDIHANLIQVNEEIKDCFNKRSVYPISDYIKHVARIHHQLTVIHPFPEGNGRSTRAFMNAQFIRAGLPPLYIKAQDKQEYIDALAYADKKGSYDDLYEVIFRAMLEAFADLLEH